MIRKRKPKEHDQSSKGLANPEFYILNYLFLFFPSKHETMK